VQRVAQPAGLVASLAPPGTVPIALLALLCTRPTAETAAFAALSGFLCIVRLAAQGLMPLLHCGEATQVPPVQQPTDETAEPMHCQRLEAGRAEAKKWVATCVCMCLCCRGLTLRNRTRPHAMLIPNTQKSASIGRSKWTTVLMRIKRKQGSWTAIPPHPIQVPTDTETLLGAQNSNLSPSRHGSPLPTHPENRG